MIESPVGTNTLLDAVIGVPIDCTIGALVDIVLSWVSIDAKWAWTSAVAGGPSNTKVFVDSSYSKRMSTTSPLSKVMVAPLPRRTTLLTGMI